MSKTKALDAATIKVAEAAGAKAAMAELRADIAESINDLAKNARVPDPADPMTPVKERIKKAIIGNPPGKPYPGYDYRGITFSPKLLEKVNANVMHEYKDLATFNIAKNAEQARNRYPWLKDHTDSVAVANQQYFDQSYYSNAFDNVFYLSTDPTSVAHNEKYVMPDVISKIRQYERVYGTAEVLTPGARDSLIGELLVENLSGAGDGYSSNGYLSYDKSYPKEMGITSAEARHIWMLVKTLSVHRAFDKIVTEVLDSKKTTKEHFDKFLDVIPYPSREPSVLAQEAFRKLQVIKTLVNLVIPSDVKRDLISREPEYSGTDTTWKQTSDASDRMRRAAMRYIEGGSLADLLQAIGGYTLAVRQKYDNVVKSVNDSFVYLSNNGLKFAEVFEETTSIHERTFRNGDSRGSFDWNEPY